MILSEIRAGHTGGFCAQYCYVLVQALQSFGVPARLVTIADHEVSEVWLESERRWVMLDPLYELQVFNQRGLSLSALGIRRGLDEGQRLTLSADHRFPGRDGAYLARFRRLGYWLRNDLVDRPLNFTDLRRYTVWFDPAPDDCPPEQALSTTAARDVYPGAEELPARSSNLPSPDTAAR
jgi:hypothetical protein